MNVPCKARSDIGILGYLFYFLFVLGFVCLFVFCVLKKNQTSTEDVIPSTF